MVQLREGCWCSTLDLLLLYRVDPIGHHHTYHHQDHHVHSSSIYQYSISVPFDNHYGHRYSNPHTANDSHGIDDRD